MILTCPNCGTQYVVKDGTIPPEGRQVRCASCKHSWHQDPDDTGSAANAVEPREDAAPVVQAGHADLEPGPTSANEPTSETLAEATLIEPRSGPEAEERAYEEAVVESAPDGALGGTAPGTADEGADPERAAGLESGARPADWDEPPVAEDAPDVFTPFAEDEQQPRRRGGASLLVIVLLVIVAAAAAFWLLSSPSLKARLGLATPGSTPLQLVTTHMDRQHLESGNDLLTLTGRVINPSAREQVVPPIEAQLKNHSGKVVYSWTIQPPAQSLPAGGSASFNSAEVSVPPGGDELTITLGGGKTSGL